MWHALKNKDRLVRINARKGQVREFLPSAGCNSLSLLDEASVQVQSRLNSFASHAGA
jgi:hypothetical protein